MKKILKDLRDNLITKRDCEQGLLDNGLPRRFLDYANTFLDHKLWEIMEEMAGSPLSETSGSSVNGGLFDGNDDDDDVGGEEQQFGCFPWTRSPQRPSPTTASPKTAPTETSLVGRTVTLTTGKHVRKMGMITKINPKTGRYTIEISRAGCVGKPDTTSVGRNGFTVMKKTG
jgi:hypothetical protein